MKKNDTSLLKYYRTGKAAGYILLFFILAVFLFRHLDLSLEQKENSRRIGASYMTMNNEFFKIINEQIRDRVEAEGDMLYLRDPALSAERQREQIGKLLDMGITALILNPVDPDGLDEVLQRARDQGVYVVVVDSAVNNDDLVQCTIMSDYYNAGCLDALYMMETQKNGEIVVMTHERTDSAKQRVRGFLDTISGNSAFTVKGMVECAGQFEIALPEMRKYIEEGNDFDTVFCLNDPAAEGVVAALQEKGLAGKVNVYGVDASPDAKAQISAGQMQASAVQFPTKLGETAADVLYRMIDGETVDKTIIVHVDIVTRDHIGQYDNERWQ